MRASRPAVRLLAALLALGAVTTSAAFAQDGPTQPPKDPKDWPGKGAAGVFDLWTQRRQEFWNHRQKDQGAVVFFGDSITHRWTGLAKAFPDVKVANRGIGGDSSRRCLFRFREDVLDLNPRAVVILIGTNDMGHSTTPSDAANNIRIMLDQATRHNPVKGSPYVDAETGIAFFGTEDGSLHALKMQDGSPVAGYPIRLNQEGGFTGSPVVLPMANGQTTIFMASTSGSFHAVNAAAPTRALRFDTTDPTIPFLGTPALSGPTMDDVIVAVAADGMMYGFSVRDALNLS